MSLTRMVTELLAINFHLIIHYDVLRKITELDEDSGSTTRVITGYES